MGGSLVRAECSVRGWGLRNLRIRSQEEPHLKAMVGLVGAAVFVISCMPIPVPTAGTCSHPCGTGMAAILIGPSLTVVVCKYCSGTPGVVSGARRFDHPGRGHLLHGGDGSICGVRVFLSWPSAWGLRRLSAAFMAGILSDWATYAVTSLAWDRATCGWLRREPCSSPYSWPSSLHRFPWGSWKGFLCAGAYRLVHNRRPEFLGMLAKGDAL